MPLKPKTIGKIIHTVFNITKAEDWMVRFVKTSELKNNLKICERLIFRLK